MASLPLALVLEQINIGDMGHVCLVLSRGGEAVVACWPEQLGVWFNAM